MSSSPRILWSLTRGERARYLGAVAALAGSVGLAYLVPLVIGFVIDGALGGGLESGGGAAAARSPLATLVRARPWLAALAIVAITAGSGALRYLQGRLVARAAERIARRLRDRLHDHIQHLPLRYHDTADTGDLVQRCTSDVETVRTFVSQQVIDIARAVLLVLLAVPVMLWRDARMTLVALCLFPLITWLAWRFFGAVQVRFRAADEAEGEMTSVLQENLTGIRVVRAFGRREFECERFGDSNRNFRDLNFHLIRLLARYWAASDLLCLGQVGLVLLAGATFIRSGDSSVGALFTFMAWVNLLIWPVRQTGRILSESGKAIVSLGRLQEVLDEPAEADPPPGEETALPSRWRGELRMEGLRFSHDGVTEALRGVDLHVRPGETVALVGPPGAGKSTLVSLLLRLHDPAAGTIRLDGVDLARLPRKTARRLVATVLQQPFLYSKTLGDNVRLARAEASERDVTGAAKDACLHETVQRFRLGYETLVGERGVTLSGGQRQRVAIARALLEQAPVLVLDDALSAVDTRTEASIRQALARRHGRRTTLVVAHRLSTVQAADRIVVLEEGRVVQEGTHEQLAETPGPYRRFWRVQALLEEELDEDLRGADLRTGEGGTP